MSTIAAVPRQPVLADAIVRSRSIATTIALVGAGALVVAGLAQLTIPLPVVPITGQTLGVMLVGAALGSRRGAAALMTYMMMGLAGAPVFAGFMGGPAMLAAPSFGYVIGFIPAAYVAGWMAEHAWDRHLVRAFAGFALASILPFVTGVPYMAWILTTVMGHTMNLSEIVAAGITPFIAGGIIKAAIAAALIPAAWSLVRRIDSHAGLRS